MLNRARLAFPWWLPVVLVALVLRVVVLASNSVSFHSDEAIVGLMARHINHGLPIPVFFYGQPYMGSLDPLLVSLAFRFSGETVFGIRLVQSILYLATVGTTLALAYRLFRDRVLAGIAGLLVAVPPVVMTLYTTISLGGYGETLLIGNLLLVTGYDLRTSHWQSRWRWLALGALAGLGWWTNNLIVAYALPVGIILIAAWRRLPWKLVALAVAAFIVCSGPWWIYNLSHDWESVRFLLGGFSSPSGSLIGSNEKLFGLLLLGLPAIVGVRYPWTMQPWLGGWAIPVIILVALLLAPTALAAFRRPGPARFLWIMVAGFSLLFVFSSFGVDATGRYLLPLIVPVAILLAMEIRRLSNRFTWAFVLPAIFVVVNLVGTVRAMQTVPPGLTPQFDPATDFPNTDDQAVIDFLEQHNGRLGYATYWVTYRLSFLSGESVILAPLLPYKASLAYFDINRYPPYSEKVEQAATVPVYVTANLPQLDQAIAQRLDSKGITYSRQQIGTFTIFYDLSRRITPGELGVQSLGPH